MSKPPSANALREWLHPCLDAAREPSAPGPDGGAIGLAMRADAEKFDRFRYAVLRRALVDHVRQDRRQTERLLRAEVFGEASPPLVDFEREDVLEGEDGLTFESLTPESLVEIAQALGAQVTDSTDYYRRQENTAAFARLTGLTQLSTTIAAQLMEENSSFRMRWMKVMAAGI